MNKIQMNNVRRIIHKEKEVLIVDYSNCKEAEMIKVFNYAKDLVQRENKNVVALSIFNNKNFVTPKFVRHLESELGEVEALITKNSVVGLSVPQTWILKGINTWYKRKIFPFRTQSEALDFLTE
jgi:hypothetical protein